MSVIKIKERPERGDKYPLRVDRSNTSSGSFSIPGGETNVNTNNFSGCADCGRSHADCMVGGEDTHMMMEILSEVFWPILFFVVFPLLVHCFIEGVSRD